jgi:DNA-binding response OmpR family regulator
MTTSTPARVAVVDDERRIRELLELSLRHHGFEVRSAADGQAALALVREWPPDIIVLDVMMPKIDGITLLPMLRRITEAPVVMLSAKGELEDKVEGLGHGADDYLSKPFEISELIAHRSETAPSPYRASRHAALRRHRRRSPDARSASRGKAPRSLAFGIQIVDDAAPASQARLHARGFDRTRLGGESDVSDAAVERYISYLRVKVDEGFERRLIHTVRGAGYTIREE